MRANRFILGLLILWLASCSGGAGGGAPEGAAAGVVSGPVDIPVTIAKAEIDPFSVRIVSLESGVSILSGALEGESCDSEEIIEASIPGGLNMTATTEDCKFEFPLSADVKGVIISLAIHTEEPSVYVKVASDGTTSVFSASCGEAVLEHEECSGCYPQCSFEEPEQVSFLCPTKEGLQSCQQSAVKPTRFTLTGPETAARGECSTPFTVTTVDGAGTARNVTEDTEVALSGTGSGLFYTDSSCKKSVTAPVMAAGQSQMTLYFKDNTAENLLLKVSGVLDTASLSFAVGTAAPTLLSVSGNTEINYHTCTLYYVTSTDDTGTASPVSSDTTISLSGGGHGAFYAGSACKTDNLITSVVLPKGAHTTQFYFSDDMPETVKLIADDAGALTASVLNVTVRVK